VNGVSGVRGVSGTREWRGSGSGSEQRGSGLGVSGVRGVDERAKRKPENVSYWLKAT
jgi:hypothetical protein